MVPMTLFLMAVALLALAALGPTTVEAAKLKTRALVIFGDSFTDQDNLFKLTNGTTPSPQIYWKGRFTNGPNWVDYLVEKMKKNKKLKVKLHNYAYGGATACALGPVSSRFSSMIKDLTNQTAFYLADKAAGKLSLKNTSPLYIQFVGTNDIAESLALNPLTPAAQLVQRVAGCAIANVRVLVERGGAKTVALVPYGSLDWSPDIVPAFKPAVKAIIDAADNVTATALKALQTQYKASNASSGLRSVRLHYLGNQGIYQGGLALFNITTVPCVNETSSLLPGSTTSTCSNPNDYLFYSALHPTTLFHKWLALKVLLPRMQKLGLLPKKL